MLAGLSLYAACVAGLLIAEIRSARFWQMIFKPLAALGFCGLAVYSGALGSLYGQFILAGLAACAAGDVCLLSRSKPAVFKLGMGAFALGHILYAIGFHTLDTEAKIQWLSSLPILAGFAFFLWAKPKLPQDMVVPVAIYSAIIILMVMAALDVPAIIVPIAAIMFALSDMFVARDRFIAPSPLNALAITPHYFGAQALFALSV